MKYFTILLLSIILVGCGTITVKHEIINAEEDLVNDPVVTVTGNVTNTTTIIVTGNMPITITPSGNLGELPYGF